MTGAHDWLVPDWPAPRGVASLITTRNGGVSSGAIASFNLSFNVGDCNDAVEKNRAQLRAHLPSEPHWLHQVHGARVIEAGRETAPASADASFTRERGAVCAVLVADCLPVLLCDDAGTVAGIAHAGWRGLSAGVIENTVQRMNVAADRLLAFLGPAIGPGAFEVGAEVRDAFIARDPAAARAFTEHADRKWLADLFLLARLRLALCGVDRVYGGGLCTFSDARSWYSYRRERNTGRMGAFIWLTAD